MPIRLSYIPVNVLRKWTEKFSCGYYFKSYYVMTILANSCLKVSLIRSKAVWRPALRSRWPMFVWRAHGVLHADLHPIEAHTWAYTGSQQGKKSCRDWWVEHGGWAEWAKSMECQWWLGASWQYSHRTDLVTLVGQTCTTIDYVWCGELTHWTLVTLCADKGLVNSDSGNGLVPYGTKTLPETMLTSTRCYGIDHSTIL